MDPKNSKALYRRALALKGENEYTEALQDLKNAININPTDKKMHSELRSLQIIMQKYLCKEKIFYTNMFK